jgi:putative transcriptional regulator
LSARSVRQKLNMTQEEFASALRIPVAALRNWEENRVAPDPSALSLIKVVAKNPKAVFDALKEPS